jgi:hypothetical protein
MTTFPNVLPRRGDVVVVVHDNGSCSLAYAESVMRDGIVRKVRYAGKVMAVEQFEKLWTLTGDHKQRNARKLAELAQNWGSLEALRTVLRNSP